MLVLENLNSYWAQQTQERRVKIKIVWKKKGLQNEFSIYTVWWLKASYNWH